MSEFATKIIAIQQKIKNFTQAQPSDKGVSDPSYKVYLSKCSRLLELDVQLNNFQNSMEDYSKADIENILTELDHQVSEITEDAHDDKSCTPKSTASVAR